MDAFNNSQGKAVVLRLAQSIEDSAAYLSEIDGAIGDGDHGINMRKGFLKARDALANQDVNLSQSLDTLGSTLLTEIGGAMGPLYGMLFTQMAAACASADVIDAKVFGAMLDAAVRAVRELSDAKVGDKTLLDTLVPARDAYRAALETGADFAAALGQMAAAAEQGKESTRELVAKVGRASRLGERSRGHLDAGATSCSIILKTLAEAITDLLQ
ncbi:MAG: dihydroxyacetone kinase subunit DhaL [Aggregatilineales bacterium]